MTEPVAVALRRLVNDLVKLGPPEQQPDGGAVVIQRRVELDILLERVAELERRPGS